MQRLHSVVIISLVFLFALSVLLLSKTFARDLVLDSGLRAVQGAAPNSTLSVLVSSTASRNFSLSNLLWFSFTPVSDCKGRLQNTSAKGSNPQFTLTGGVTYSAVKHSKTNFFNISGCTGDYQAMD